MGFFFTSGRKKLSEKEIDRALSSAGVLESSDKEEIRRRLRKRRGGGVTKSDVMKVTRDLKRDTKDSVSRAEADAARRELMDELED